VANFEAKIVNSNFSFMTKAGGRRKMISFGAGMDWFHKINHCFSMYYDLTMNGWSNFRVLQLLNKNKHRINQPAYEE
jgi:hypothetical protein